MKRPASLTIVAVILFLMGLSGMVADCIRAHGLALLSVNFFNMIAGVGLLKLWRGARQYCNFLFGCLFLIMIPMSVWLICNPDKIVINFPSILIDDRTHPTAPLMLAVPIIIGYIVLSGWILFVLNRHDVRELFSKKSIAANSSITI
jgi:hypothetical protein